MSRQISRTYEKKNGRTYYETFRTEDAGRVFEDLANILINKYVFKSSTYRRIEDCNNYDGTRTIKIYDDINGRNVFIVPDH